ncbi:MAG: sulfur carrier protein ThiS, partial [Candidatus Acidiferrales bacterium]
LLEHLQLKRERLAVERNRKIVKREDWPRVKLLPGDQLEVVHFVGGG